MNRRRREGTRQERAGFQLQPSYQNAPYDSVLQHRPVLVRLWSGSLSGQEGVEGGTKKVREVPVRALIWLTRTFSRLCYEQIGPWPSLPNIDPKIHQIVPVRVLFCQLKRGEVGSYPHTRPQRYQGDICPKGMKGTYDYPFRNY